MGDSVRGNPELLAAYSEDMLPQVGALRPLVEDHAAAVSAYNAASPNDLGSSVPDRSGAIDASLEALHRLDRLPAAFAEALRSVDRFGDGLEVLPDWFGYSGTRDERLLALTRARLEQPFATDAELMAAAKESLRHGVVWPWRDGVVAWLLEDLRSPTRWTDAAIGLGTSVVDSAGRPTQQRGLVVPVRAHWNRGNWIDAHYRWRPGYAPGMNRVTSANTAARWGPRIGRIGTAANLVLAGVGQAMEDWDDPTLSTGDRVARVSTATFFEGGGGAVGSVAGAMIGQAVIPIPVVGAVVGGMIGGWIGGQVGEVANENTEGVTEALGDGIDGAIDVGSDLLDDIGGLFG